MSHLRSAVRLLILRVLIVLVFFGDFASGGSFFLEFQVSEVGTISVAVGQEAAPIPGDPDPDASNLDITSVSLTNPGGVDPAVSSIEIFTEPDEAFDRFAATWFSLLPGNTYRLTVDFDGTDSFSGNLRFAAIPVPPAAVLFGTALLGMGFLSRRRRRRMNSIVTAS